MSLAISREIFEQMERHARGGFPLECCGLMIGRLGGAAVEEVRPLKNAWQGGDLERRYAIDPRDWIRIEKEFSGMERGIIGVYHSHPRASAQPSAFDAERAWPNYFYLILSVPENGPITARCWKLDEKDAMMRETELAIGEGARMAAGE
ncbi:MAG: hypothetical protein A3G41_07310 [Elusimicrobia bacterium RIFCSPLOWO2_12_FULL_59_9]|nr:MAG: hypothetical protein A3G41_07310 [Elusimicrobia bacterium RIFCSPLOWO2_12_FULL_59_9]